jgi:hypothetical protein
MRAHAREGLRLAIIFICFVSLVATIFFYPNAVHAGSDGYICTVAALSRLADDGTLSRKANDAANDPIIGKVFIVDRDIGKIIGNHINSRGFDTKVLDRGSDQQSCKVLTTNPLGFLHVKYLEIQEFHEGPRKPFLLVDGSAVYSGTCE